MDKKQLELEKDEAVNFLETIVRKVPTREQQRAEDCMKFATAFSSIACNADKKPRTSG